MAGGYPNGVGTVRTQEWSLTTYVVIVCIAAASGGLVIGYDIGITGGASAMDDFVQTFFPTEYRDNIKTNNYCQYDNQTFQAFKSSIYLAGVFAVWSASVICETRGRRPCIVAAGVSIFFGTLINVAARNVVTLVVGRIFIGIGVGFGYQSVPLFLSEMAPPRHRGGLNIMFQLSITIGILCANFVDYGASKIHPWGWRFSLALATIPAMCLAVGGLFIPETPISLIQRDKVIEGREILVKIRGTVVVDDEYHDMLEASRGAKTLRHPLSMLTEKRYSPYVVMAIFLPFAQVATGIHAILFYVPHLITTMGLGSDSHLYGALVIGSILCLSTVVSLVLVDQVGRKTLLYQGGVQMFICQTAIGVLLKYNMGLYNTISRPIAGVLLILINICVAAFGWSWGSLLWTVSGELFPLEIRSAGQSLLVSTNFFCTFLMNQALLTILCKFEHLTFLFFAGWILVITSLVWFLLPETSNVPIERVGNLWRAHWLWKRFADAEPDNGT